MSVREQDGVELAIRLGRRSVERFHAPAALKQTAIHEHAGLGGLNNVSRAGDFAAGGADDGDFHFPGAGFNWDRTFAGRLRTMSSTASRGESVMRPKPISSRANTPCFIMYSPQMRKPSQ